MMEDEEETPDYIENIEQREREEMEFFTDLAVQEMQRWIEAVTKKKFKYADDPKGSLADGIHLCELLNAISPGTIKRINRLPTAMAGMDNLNVFIEASKHTFGLKEAQLFSPTDLQDVFEKKRNQEDSNPVQKKELEDKKLRNVAITVFWLARQVQGFYSGPELDFANFTALVNAKQLNSSLSSTGSFVPQHQYSSSGDWSESDRHSRTSSRDSSDIMIRRGDSRDNLKQKEARYSSSDSLDELGRGQSEKGRRPSQSAYDPLQFVATKPAAALASKASKQIEVAKQTKKIRDTIDRDEYDWSNNLSSWKQRRQSKSNSSFSDRDNDVIDEKYTKYERANREDTSYHYSQHSNSSYSFDEDDSPYSPRGHKNQRSDTSNSFDEKEFEEENVNSLGSTSEFQPPSENVSAKVISVMDVIERATIKPVQAPYQEISPGDKQKSSKQENSPRSQTQSSDKENSPRTYAPLPSSGKSKMRVKVTTSLASDDGFGFTIKGGKDKCQPITIDSIVNDSPADKADLLEGDEIVEINDEVVTEKNRGYCMLLINGSLQKSGKLDLYIKRDYSKVPQSAKDRRSGATTTITKTILDIYNERNNAGDSVDGQNAKNDVFENEESETQSLEKHYVHATDGGYDSAVSTLRSADPTEDDSDYQPIRVMKVNVVHMAHSREDSSPSEHYSQGFSSNSQSIEDLNVQGLDRMPVVNYEDLQDKVTKDFEEVLPSMQTDVSMEKRSKRVDQDTRKRMEEWQKQQEKIQQEQYEKENREIQELIEKSRRDAEEQEQNRKNLTENDLSGGDGVASRLSNLRIGLTANKERETREKAVQRLLEIKARYNQQEEAGKADQERKPGSMLSPSTGSIHDSQSSLDRLDDSADDDGFARKSHKPKKDSDEMRQFEQRSYYSYKSESVGSTNSSTTQETPYLSDVYKYYDEDLPSNFGEKDPSPPPITRKDVLNLNKKSIRTDVNNQQKPRATSTYVEDAPMARGKVEASRQYLSERRKSTPPRWKSEDDDSSGVSKSSDADPNMPSLRKEDVIKLNREKARFSSQDKPTGQLTRAKSVSEQDNDGEGNSKGFFANRAMFEQQSKEAERKWAEQAKPVQKKVPVKSQPQARSMSTVKAPQIKKEFRSKSVDVRQAPVFKTEVVRSVHASDAAYERMKELAMMKKLREQEAAEAEEEEQERRKNEKKLREERQRELAEIRKLNQQYEAASQSNQQQYDNYEDEDDEETARLRELENARKRMVREAEEVAKAQARHDQEVKNIHGRDMQAERRKVVAEQSRISSAEEDRSSREIADFDRDDKRDAMARRRHQEMLEQSRRDQDRREEAKRVEQQNRASREMVANNAKPRQQIEDDIFKPSSGTDKNVYDTRAAHKSNQRQTNGSYDSPDKSAGNYDRHPTKNDLSHNPMSRPYSAERQNVNSGQIDGLPLAPTKQAIAQAPYHRSQNSLDKPLAPPQGYENQIAGNSKTNFFYTNRESAQPWTKERSNGLYNEEHGTNESVERKAYTGYSTTSDSNNDLRYSSELGRIPNYNQPVRRADDPQSNLRNQNSLNNNDPSKQSVYTNEKFESFNGGSNKASVPSKPPRASQLSPEEESMNRVSAKFSCAYCGQELGKGAAMVIESLQLYYHVECFRCCVCHSLLSNGQKGADVRVRVNKLHCKNCYSNDDAGIKYSAV